MNLTTFVNISNPECIIRRRVLVTWPSRWKCKNGETLLASQWQIKK